jgi:hypothetical protein
MSSTLRVAGFLATSVALVIGCAAPADDQDDASSAAVTGAPAASSQTSGATGFVCECTATGPGYETSITDKNCSYACACDLFDAKGMTKAPTFSTPNTVTSAKSYEKWDFGSHICHGQYAWRPNLSSPNWQIKVKFSPFKITHFANVSYAEESVETATGVRESLKRSEAAPEIRDVIAKRFGVRVPPSTSR